MRIPVVNFRPILDATRAAWQARLEELFTRQQFILGPQVAAFEKEWAAFLDARHAIGVSNGSTAIELCLRDAGITQPRQFVLTSALTAPFTAVAIQASGATATFADIDPETLQIDPDDAGNRLRKNVAALVPVHLYGQPCPIDRFARLARDRKLTLIQDACQAHGARFEGRPFTDFSPYVAFSFYPTKNLGCLGDGGAIATSRPAAAKRLTELRDGGRRGGQVSFRRGAINARLDEMQACYLRAFLPHLAEWNDWRRKIAAFYDSALAGCPGVQLVKRHPCSVCHLYVIRAARRDKLRAHLAQAGIGTGIHYPSPLHLQPAFRDAGLKKGDLPHAEKACREILSLPLWPYLAESDAAEVADRIRQFYAG